MTDTKIKIILFLAAVIVGIIWMFTPNKESENEKKFIRSLNLKFSGVVKKVMPMQAEDHGYGAIYLENFTSNKGDEYDCRYKEKYIFCKISKKQAIIVTPGVTEIQVNDSVTYDTNTLTYKVYKRGKIYVENGIALDDSDSFYDALKIDGYLDFSYYDKKDR